MNGPQGHGVPTGCWKARDMDMSMHWWQPRAKPGDACLCGEKTMRERTDLAPEDPAGEDRGHGT